MNQKQKKIIIIAVAAVLVLAAALGIVWFVRSHVFVDGKVYAKNAPVLDLREKQITVEHYEAVQELLPDCEIEWMVPFQESYYAEDTQKLTLTSLTEEEVEVLDYLPELEVVDAVGCTDYDQLLALQARHSECQVLYTVSVDGQDYPQDSTKLTVTDLTAEELALLQYLPELKAVNAEGCQNYAMLKQLQETYPDCEVSYFVTVAGASYNESTTSLSLTDPDMEELAEMLAYLPRLESVDIAAPTCTAEELTALREAYPNVAINWSKELLGKTFFTTDTEIDISGVKLETLDEVEAAMAYFPDAEKLVLGRCGLDNELLAEYRERVRADYKVVWSMRIGTLTVRTDDIYFMPVKYGGEISNYQLQNLYYCEDMLCVDLGHYPVVNIDWVKGMPHLKYLIVADGPLVYIDAISTCKELIYLELFDTHISDYTPLLGCTALQDLNVADTFGDPLVFTEMTWLNNLWINQCGVTREERQLLTESLPNTRIEFDHGSYCGGGWRDVQNYFDMRDLLGMPYNTW